MSCQARGWDFATQTVFGTVYNKLNSSKWWIHYTYNGQVKNVSFTMANNSANIVIANGITIQVFLNADGSNIQLSYNYGGYIGANGPYNLDPVSNGWISAQQCSSSNTMIPRVSSTTVRTISKTVLISSGVIFLLLVLLVLLYLFIGSK